METVLLTEDMLREAAALSDKLEISLV